MEKIKNFLFYSFAFSTGLLIYTIILYLGYIIFMADDSSSNEISSVQNKENTEKITDLNDLDCLEDA